MHAPSQLPIYGITCHVSSQTYQPGEAWKERGVPGWTRPSIHRSRMRKSCVRYTQILSQAYRLARKKVREGPAIPHLPENNVRQGFFEHVDFLVVVRQLPEDLQDFARWSYLCGWRKGEVAALAWNQFEMEARLMHLSGRETKKRK